MQSSLLTNSGQAKFKVITHAILSPLSLIPIGLLSYMLYLQVKFGDWLYFWHVQPIFGAERSGSTVVLLPQVIWRYLKILLTVSPINEIYWISLLELTVTIIVLSLLAIAHVKKVRFSYLIFSWLAIITPTLTGTLSSMPRYALVIFPIYIILASVKKPIARIAIMSTLLVLFFLLTILFTRGHWVG